MTRNLFYKPCRLADFCTFLGTQEILALSYDLPISAEWTALVFLVGMLVDGEITT